MTHGESLTTQRVLPENPPPWRATHPGNPGVRPSAHVPGFADLVKDRGIGQMTKLLDHKCDPTK